MQKYIGPDAGRSLDLGIDTQEFLSTQATVRREVSLDLPNYLGKGKGTLRIYPRLTRGISINGVEVNPQNTHGVTELVARFNVAKDDENAGKIFKVIEHLVSALWAAGVTNADIQTDTIWKFLPVIGPGIEPVYSALKGELVYLKDRPLDLYECNHTVEVKSRLEKSPGMIRIEPSKSGKFEIEVSATYKDVKGMQSRPIVIDDVYSQIEKHKEARPIARIQSQVLRAVHGLVDKTIGLAGINKTTYIMPDSTPEGNYLGQMHSQYQAEGNEHFAHTVYADFFGELHTYFPGKMGAVKITVQGGGHPGRLDMLKQLVEMGALTPYPQTPAGESLIAAE